MQKISIKKLFLAAILGLNLSTYAATNIGVINSELIMRNSTLTAPFQEKIASFQRGLEEMIKALDADLEKMYKSLQAKAKISDNSALEREQEALNDAKNKRDLEFKSAGEKAQRFANKVMEEFAKLVQDAAQKVLEKNNLDLIIDKTTTLAYSKSIDVTDKLIVEIQALQGGATKTADAAKNNKAVAGK